MKQIIQSFKTGETILGDIPTPQVRVGHVLIKTSRSLVSLGTERMLVEFGKANLIQKARQQPDKVKLVLDKIRTDGILPTLESVFNKLEQPLPLGYCNVGEIVEIGKGVSGFKVGDRVASNGPHAEYVCVPKNLVAKIPDNVSDEEASFTVIGAIGLQGIRLLDPRLGETVVVTGLGLIGLITAQLLVANGCHVIGIELDQHKIEVAKSLGIYTINPLETNNPVSAVHAKTNGIGADGVIITASAKYNDIIKQAAQMSRKRGKIVLVGVVGLNIDRSDFYEKELSFQVSCSYGPGRYDEDYEQKGLDYPIAYVRWTEKRNFETVLKAISTNRLNVKALVSEVIDLDNYHTIYDDIGNKKSIASILKYPEQKEIQRTVHLEEHNYSASENAIGIIGAGNFTKMTLLPALKKTRSKIKYISSAGGLNGTALAKKYGIPNSTTDYNEILKDEQVNTVIITTRHDLHAKITIRVLQAGKNVFVEKPLALNHQELINIISAYRQNQNSTITVGFNRRFSPHIQKIKEAINPDENKHIIATMNSGYIPPEAWVHDIQIGGGRIIGEACHFIDLITYLSGSKVKSVCMNSMGITPEDNTDNATILLKYENGDNGVINYFANGSKSYPKERIEIFSGGKTLIVDNFRKTTAYGVKGFSKYKSKLDKGHAAQFKLLMERIKQGGEPLIPFEEIVNTTQASFAAIQSLKEQKWVDIPTEF